MKRRKDMKHKIKRSILALLACAMILSISCSPSSNSTDQGSTEKQEAQTDTRIEGTSTPTEDLQTEDLASTDIMTDAETNAPVEDNETADEASDTPGGADTTEPTEDTESISGDETNAPVEDNETTDVTTSDVTTSEPMQESTQLEDETTSGDTTSDETSAPHTHAYGVWTAVKKATCTASGTEQRTCVCGDKQTRAVNATGHTEITVKGKAATCTESGLTDGKKCSVCGTVTVKQTAIKAKGHTEITVSGKSATCSENGLTAGKKCSVCGVFTVKQATVQAKGHKYITLSEPNGDPYSADFMKSGQEKCSVCGDEQEIKYKTPNVSDEEYARLLAQRMLYYINEYRKAEGSPTAQMLPNMTEYAEYRAVQLSTNFAHDGDDEGAAATALKYGQYYEFEESYLDLETMEVVYTGNILKGYAPQCGEAILTNSKWWLNLNDRAKQMATQVFESKGHWGNDCGGVGDPVRIYVSIGCYYCNDKFYCAVCTSDTDIYG